MPSMAVQKQGSARDISALQQPEKRTRQHPHRIKLQRADSAPVRCLISSMNKTEIRVVLGRLR